MTRPYPPYPWDLADEIAADTGRTPIIVEGVFACVIRDPGHGVLVLPEHPDAEILYIHDAVNGTTWTTELHRRNAYHESARACGGSRPTDVVRHIIGLGHHSCEAIRVVGGDGATECVVVMSGWDPGPRLMLLTEGGRTTPEDPQMTWEVDDLSDLGLDGLPEPDPGDEDAVRMAEEEARARWAEERACQPSAADPGGTDAVGTTMSPGDPSDDELGPLGDW